MKYTCRLLLLITIVSLWACAARTTVPQGPPRPDPDTIAFEEAEDLFRQQSYEDALKAYSQYLNRFPDGSSTALSLKRIATIHGYFGDREAKLKAWRRLATEYPDSPYAPDAEYEIMMMFYREGKWREVILRASAIIKKSNRKDLMVGTYTILGDTYVTLGSPVDAVFFYNLAYSNADLIQKKSIINKLKGIVNLLNQKDVTLLSRHLDQDSLKSHLLYLIAFMEYDSENYKAAKKAFLVFLEAFPRHKDAEQAKLLIAEIDQRTAFRRELIGCMLPLSGPFEAFGNRALKAIQLSLDRFKALSGKLNFQLIVTDTGSDPEAISRLVSYLDKQRVALIIGPLVTSKKAAVEAQKRKIPIITLTQKTGIPDIGDYVFRNFLTPEMQVDTLLASAIDQFGANRFAILYPNDTYGNTFMRLFRDKAQYYGADIVRIASYPPDQTDFSSPIKQLARISEIQAEIISTPHRQAFKDNGGRRPAAGVALDFDAIFIPDSPAKTALIAPQLAYWDVDDVLLMGTNLWHSDRLVDLARNYVQDAILTDVYYAQSAHKSVQNFIRSFEQEYGQRPGFIEGLAYDTAMMAFHTAANPDVRSRKDLKDQLKEITDYEGATGLTSFKANGEAQKKLYLLQISGRNFVELQ